LDLFVREESPLNEKMNQNEKTKQKSKIFVYFMSNICYNENDWEVSV
jgi:hypothetical protein